MFVRAALAATSLATACALTLSSCSSVTNDARNAADAAVEAIRNGDLVALDKQLATNTGERPFAYYFARQVTPRELGDALAAVADLDLSSGEVENAETATAVSAETAAPTGFDAAAYERVLDNLADSLALATRDAPGLELPASWAENFAAYMTSETTEVGEAGVDAARVAQDLANKQNLLLLLSRGHWSTPFLQEVTRAIWDWEHATENSEGASPWPGSVVEGAKYARAPNGAFLTDGMVALMAALTANPEAAGWAFSDFQPETIGLTYDGAEHALGKFAHFVFLKHRYAQSPDTGAANLGITASRTALVTATEATGGSYAEGAAGPLADVFVLQAYEEALTSEPNGSKSALEKVGGFFSKHGHAALDFVGMVPVVGEAADVLSGAWYAIEGDWSNAGLSVAAVVPLAGAAAGVVKVVKSIRKAGDLVDRSGAAIDTSTDGARLLAKAKTSGDGAYEFESADDFLAALDQPVPGVTYKHGDTTYEVSSDGKTLIHLSGPDRRTIAKDVPHPTLQGRNRLGQCISSDCKLESMAKEEQGIRDYEKAYGVVVDRRQVMAKVAGVEHGRFYDGLVRKPDGTYEAIEVKSGEAVRNANQSAFDACVSDTNPATAVLSTGESIQITSIRTVRVP